MFRNVGIAVNREKEEAVEMAERARSFFSEHGIQCGYLHEDAGCARDMDLVLTFGGDGTFLSGARFAMEYGIPLLGINLGTVGFLTEEEPEHLDGCLKALMEGKFREEERFLLKIRARGGEFLALNDAVITRGRFARLIRVECRVNGEPYGVFTADGMIAATPTGSTGYSLSAGGPIVQPEMNCIVLTPVCAHSLQSCPCIVSGSSGITMRLTPERKQTAELQIDGMDRGKLEAGDEIFITGADKSVKLLRIHPYHFFSLLQDKLIEWGSRR